MPTNNSINSSIPIEILKGGTNANISTNGLLKYDGTSFSPTSASINANEIITNTNQVAFFAYNTIPVADVTGDGTYYFFVCDTATVNQGSAYNTTTGVFTAPVTGKYIFGSTNLCPDFPLDNDWYEIQSRISYDISGPNYKYGAGLFSAGGIAAASPGFFAQCVSSFQMTAGETVAPSFAFYKGWSGSGTKNIDCYGDATKPWTSFWGYLIG